MNSTSFRNTLEGRFSLNRKSLKGNILILDLQFRKAEFDGKYHNLNNHFSPEI